MTDFEELANLAVRFQGLTLEYRRQGTDWPQAWRIQTYRAKQHSDTRVTVYGDTPREAFDKLLHELEEANARLNRGIDTDAAT